jgi:hypothetical protein
MKWNIANIATESKQFFKIKKTEKIILKIILKTAQRRGKLTDCLPSGWQSCKTFFAQNWHQGQNKLERFSLLSFCGIVKNSLHVYWRIIKSSTQAGFILIFKIRLNRKKLAKEKHGSLFLWRLKKFWKLKPLMVRKIYFSKKVLP